MIRGVNKNVIEISDTGNDCFERAILFVRPESIDKGNDHIRKRASDYLAGVKLRPWFYPRGRLVMRVLGWLAAAVAGGAVTAFVLL